MEPKRYTADPLWPSTPPPQTAAAIAASDLPSGRGKTLSTLRGQAGIHS
jgi:hypothetical protein